MGTNEEKSLGQIAQEGRQAMNMEIFELALLTGINEQTLAQFEAQSIELKSRQYFQLTMFLGLSVDDFYFRACKPKTEEEAKVRSKLNEIKKMSGEDLRQKFEGLLKFMEDAMSPEQQKRVVEMVRVLIDFRKERDEYRIREG